MKAVILAAGRGTRLGDLTKDTPKPMILVAGKPVLEHKIDALISIGIKEYVLVTRYLPERIMDYFKDGSHLGINIQYAPQGEKYGTGAAMMEAYPFIGDHEVMMTFGDIVCPAKNYKNALDTYNQTNADALVGLNWVAEPWKGSSILVDESGRLTKVIEKPKKEEVISHWNSAGIFVFKPLVFDYLKRLKPSARGEYEITDTLNDLINDKYKVQGYFLEGAWNDIGTLEDLKRTEEMFAKGEL